ncbi:ABC transporter substrate-binding protein [Thorsellia kenyensis]|uniref:ABC transporter substrate-binding protein n=1 Tax=Thorsellia kenyensis TaxID=1549888 RepID=A0ABV6C8I7_9GAMM
MKQQFKSKWSNLSLWLLVPFFMVGCDGQSSAAQNENSKPAAPTEEQAAKNVAGDANPTPGGNLIIAVQDDPRVMNALYANDRVTLTINQSLNSPLFYIEPDGSKTYVLAESIEHSDDNLTYTVRLKEGLKWHDGKPIVADDLVFTMNAILDEKQKSSKRFYFVFNDKPLTVKKIDNLTVQYTLPETSAAFEAMLSLAFPIPSHVYQNEVDIQLSEHNQKPIGSGPFKFDSYKPGEYVKLVRFDDYLLGPAYLDSVIYRIAKDPNNANIALQNGELNMRKIDAVEYSKLNELNQFNMVIYPEGRLNYMVFNLNTPDLQNKAIRQAIAYAINKEDMLTVAYDSLDFALPGTSIFTPDTLYKSIPTDQYDFNIDKAKELVQNSGINAPSFKMAYVNTIPYQESQAIYLQQQLKNIGIDIKLQPLDLAAYGQMSLDPNNTAYDISFGGYIMGQEPDAYKTLYLSDAPYNYSHYKSKELDELWKAGASTLEPAKRQEIYQKIQAHIMEEMTVYPITYDKAIIAVDKKFGGLEEAMPKPVFLFRDLSKIYLIKDSKS